MKYVYHGSMTADLTIIKPGISTHMKKLVYATPSKAIATIFLSKKGNDLYYSLSGDGTNYPVELVERKAGMFKEIFNCSGYIYELNATNFKTGLTNWSGEVVSEKEEKVAYYEYIDNVYDELVRLSCNNEIKLYLYPQRPSRIPLDNSDLISKVIKWQENGFDVNIFFDLYPELKDEYVNVKKKVRRL